VTFIVIWLGCAVIAALIGQSKNRSVVGSFLLGLILGLIGIVIIALMPKKAAPLGYYTPPAPVVPAAPPGMRPVQCPRCNAAQNIPVADTSYECWQCKTFIGRRPLATTPQAIPRATAVPSQQTAATAPAKAHG
jgi:hypothetical protein